MGAGFTVRVQGSGVQGSVQGSGSAFPQSFVGEPSRERCHPAGGLPLQLSRYRSSRVVAPRARRHKVRSSRVTASGKYLLVLASSRWFWVSVSDRRAMRVKRANSRGMKAPNPSARFRGAERAESRIWSLNRRSRTDGPLDTASNIRSRRATLSFHASSSSKDLAPAMRRRMPATSQSETPGFLPKSPKRSQNLHIPAMSDVADLGRSQNAEPEPRTEP
jgi:hypothetical protein